jgi:hypothetical protein
VGCDLERGKMDYGKFATMKNEIVPYDEFDLQILYHMKLDLLRSILEKGDLDAYGRTIVIKRMTLMAFRLMEFESRSMAP